MLLSTAGLLLLSALQPALGQPTDCRGTSSNVSVKQITPNEISISYNASDARCNADVKTWVGVWEASASSTSEPKARKYLKVNETEARFTKTELGDGQWKAAFHCDNGQKTPFLISDNFEFGSGVAAPKPDSCKLKDEEDKEYTFKCDRLEVCNDCAFNHSCDQCNDCARQCGEEARFGDSGAAAPKPDSCKLKDEEDKEYTFKCDRLEVCNDCALNHSCDQCNECAVQCGKPARY
ncbi:hypothetical protein J3459_018494 [Metarhizium acridum]|nr:hypothetical protein J3459_018494 [Metarhizium acridum]